MPGIRELRQRVQASPPPERSDLPTVMLLGVAAFAIGAITIMAWTYLSAPQSSQVAAVKESPAPTFDGKRVGYAGTAPLLRACVTNSELSHAFNHAEPDAIFSLLKTTETAARLGPLFGAKGRNTGQLSEYWRELADCVYRQNSRTLCDIDNRALAVETASAFVRQAARLAANPPASRDIQAILNDNASVQERILGTLRQRVHNGLLIAADFGPLAPAEIKRVLAETKPIMNGCSK